MVDAIEQTTQLQGAAWAVKAKQGMSALLENLMLHIPFDWKAYL